MNRFDDGYLPLPDNLSPPLELCLQLTIPNDPEFYAVLWGLIERASHWYAWDRDDAHSGRLVAKTWLKILDSLQMCPPAAQDGGTDIGDDVGQSLRISPANPCIIQMWCIDHWEDWYNPTGCIGTGTAQQTSGGAGQPGAGQTQMYCFTVDETVPYFVPVNIQGGQKISVTDLTGAWNDGYSGLLSHWYCPDGAQYELGTCQESYAVLEPGDPVPTVNHMVPLLKVGSTYYPLLAGSTVTIPPGTNEIGYIIPNNDATHTPAGGGSIGLCLHIENANQASWTHVFDFTADDGGWLDQAYTVYNGVYVPGVGWEAPPVSNLGIVKYAPVGTTITHVKIVSTGTTPDDLNFYTSCFPDPCSGFDTVASGAPPTIDIDCIGIVTTEHPVIQVNQSVEVGTTSTITRVEISGTGTDPF